MEETSGRKVLSGKKTKERKRKSEESEKMEDGFLERGRFNKDKKFWLELGVNIDG